MNPINYSWIGLSAAAPLIFLLCAWVLGVFHSFRRYWRSVDLFLLAIFVQELLMALQVFSYALLSLVKPDSSAACSVFVWSLTSTRTLQAATLTSLLVDRAFTSQWPYKYRFSVRRHQIRYHLVVVATMASLVGVASILARPAEVPESFEHCTFLPHNLHVRLALFFLSVYGIMFVVGAVSATVVQISRGCRNPAPTGDRAEFSPIAHGTNTSSTTSSSSHLGRPLHSAASTTSTASSSSSGLRGNLGLHNACSTTDLVPPLPPLRAHNLSPTKGGKAFVALRATNLATDFRWSTCVAVTLISFLANHLPYLTLMVLGSFFPPMLPSWPLETVTLWLSLAEGLLLSIVLGLMDPTFSFAVGLSCRRGRTDTFSSKFRSGDEPFQLFARDEPKSFPLTNGSLFSSLLNMNDVSSGPLGPGRKGLSAAMRIGISVSDVQALAGLQSDAQLMRDNYGYYRRGTPSSVVSTGTSTQEDLYSDPLTKIHGLDGSLKLVEEDHIYATLSETFGSLSSLSESGLGDQNRCSSATTVANDDFEFHPLSISLISCSPDPQTSFVSSTDAGSFVSARNTAISRRPPAALPVVTSLPLSDSYGDSSSSVSSYRSTSCDSLTFESNRCGHHVNDMTVTSSANTGYVNCAYDDELHLVESTRIALVKVPESVPRSTEYQHYTEDILEEASPTLPWLNDGTRKCTKEYRVPEKFQKGTRRLNDGTRKVPERAPRSTEYQHDTEDILEEASPTLPWLNDGTLSKKHRNSSLSMNDLDMLDTRRDSPKEDMMFMLPMKSESMLSLYRLYLAEDSQEGTSLHYSIEISQSEGDLCSLSKENPSAGEGGDSFAQEIYQKKKAPECTSRVRRQSKIQRAKVFHQKQRPRLNETPKVVRDIYPPVQLTVMDRIRKQNGIITIRDPSVLSVEELFRVLNRASSGQSKAVDFLSSQTEVPCLPPNPPTMEYKKIFVSEYI